MKALIIKQPWIDLILEGKKDWEIRDRNSHIRGEIALIQSGTGMIVGTATLKDSKKLTFEEYQQAGSHHCIPHVEEPPYRNIHAWIFEQPQRLPQPIPYIHPKGAIIWVNVNDIHPE